MSYLDELAAKRDSAIKLIGSINETDDRCRLSATLEVAVGTLVSDSDTTGLLAAQLVASCHVLYFSDWLVGEVAAVEIVLGADAVKVTIASCLD